MSPVLPFLVIGAGLAGSSMAFELARRGHPVTVLDAAPRPAAGASGNPAGIFMPVPERRSSPREELYLEAFRWLLRLLEGPLSGVSHQRCGVLQLPRDTRQAERFADILAARSDLRPFVEAGVALLPAAARRHPHADTALHFPQAGWLSPAELCRHLLARPGIETRLNQRVTGLERGGDRLWIVHCSDGSSLRAREVVLACGPDCAALPQVATLPWHRVRGQITRIRLPGIGTAGKVLTGAGYLIPLGKDEALVGATYRRDRCDTVPDPDEDEENLAQLARLLPDLHGSPEIIGSRAALRSVLPGRLPVCGPLPGTDRAGLWITAAHASRGLLTAPWCAQQLANAMESTPSSRQSTQLLSPARFMRSV